MKRVISFLLSIVMVISMLPVSAFATDELPEETTTVTEATEPSTEATEPSTEATEPSTEATEPSAEATEPSTEATEPSAEATEPSTEVTEPSMEATEPSTEATEPSTEATEPSAEATEPEAEMTVKKVVKTYRSEAELEDTDVLLEGFLMKQFYGDNMSVFGVAAGNRLSGYARNLYNWLKEEIEAVASGEIPSARFSLDSDHLAEWGVPYQFEHEDDEAASDAVMESLQVNKVMDALLHDCPYELYWFDKINAVQELVGVGVYEGYGQCEVFEIDFVFSVVEDLMAEGSTELDPKVDTDLASSVRTAAGKAQSIVAKYSDKTAYERLVGYKDEICALVKYNEEAYKGGNFSADADPWQLMYVFDGDSATDVVCEGYSKAFQYLCDLDGSIDCYTVTGTMAGGTGAGGHMWNIVTLDDKNYIVDVTNSDSGTAGYDGSLFLSGTAGSVEAGYAFTTKAGKVSFTYDEETVSMWASDGVLTLAETKYVPDENDGGNIDLSAMTQAALESAMNAAMGEDGGALELDRSVILTGDFTVPENFTLILKSGAALTVKTGKLIVNGTIVAAAGSALTVESTAAYELHNAPVSITAELNRATVTGIEDEDIFACFIVSDTTELVKALQDAAAGGYAGAEVRPDVSFTINRDVTIPQGVSLFVRNATLTVAEGCTLTNNSRIRLLNGGGLEIASGAALVNDGIVEVNEGASFQNFGDLIGADPIYKDEGDESLNNHVVTEAELRAAIEAGCEVIFAYGDITLTSNLVLPRAEDSDIPQAQKLILDDGATLTVSTGVTLTVNGRLNIQGGSQVIVNGTLVNNVYDDGNDATDDIGIWCEDGALTVNGTYRNPNGGLIIVTANYGFAVDGKNPVPGSKIDRNAYVYNEEDLYELLADADDYAHNQICLYTGIWLSKSITVPENVLLLVDGWEGGSLNIPEGKTLTNNGLIEIIGNTEMMADHEGTLVNNGQINVAEGCRIEIVENATLTNNGTINANDKAVRISVLATYTGLDSITGEVDIIELTYMDQAALVEFINENTANGESIVALGRMFINMTESLTLDVNLAIVDGTKFMMENGATLTVNSLTVDDAILSADNSTGLVVNNELVIVNGAYVNASGNTELKQWAHIYDKAELDIYGTATNDGYLCVHPGGNLCINEGAVLNDNDNIDHRGRTYVAGTLNSKNNMYVGVSVDEGETGIASLHIDKTGVVNVEGFMNVAASGALDVDGTLELMGYMIHEGTRTNVRGTIYIAQEYGITNKGYINVAGESASMVIDGNVEVTEDASLWINDGAEITVEGVLSNYGNVHVGDYNSGTLTVKGVMGNFSYLCVHPGGTMNINAGGYVSCNFWEEDGYTGFLQCNGTVNVDGELDNEFIVTVDNTAEAPAVMNVGLNGRVNNLNGPEAFHVGENGRMNIRGDVSNHGSFIVDGEMNLEMHPGSDMLPGFRNAGWEEEIAELKVNAGASLKLTDSQLNLGEYSKTTIDPDATFEVGRDSRIDLYDGAEVVGITNREMYYNGYFKSEEELKAILDKVHSEGFYGSSLYFDDVDTVTISGELELDYNDYIHLFGSDPEWEDYTADTLILAPGAHVINKGYMHVYNDARMIVEDGATLENRGYITGNVEGSISGNQPGQGGGIWGEKVYTWEELKTALAEAGKIATENDWQAVNVMAPIAVPAKTTLTIPDCVTLYLYDELTIPSGSKLVHNNQSTLILNAPEAALTINSGATYTHRGYLQVAAGTVTNKGTYSSGGWIDLYEGGSITGISKSKIAYNAYVYDVEDLKQKVASEASNGYLETYLIVQGDLVIDESITATGKVGITVGFDEATVTIPAGVTVSTNCLVVEYGGRLEIQKGGRLNLNDYALVSQEATLENYGFVNFVKTGWMNIMGTINNHGMFNLLGGYEVGPMGQLNGDFASGVLGKMEAALVSADTYKLTEPLYIDSNVSLSYDSHKLIYVTGNGAIIVADGVSLDLSQVDICVCEGGRVELGRDVQLNVENGSSLEIQDGSLIVDENVNINIDFETGSMVVICLIDGCTVTGIDNFEQMTGLYVINSEAELLAALEEIRKGVFGDYVLVPDASFTVYSGWDEGGNAIIEIPDNVSWIQKNDNVLTIAQGAYMCFNGMMNVVHGGKINVNGTLDYCVGENGGPHFIPGYINVASNGSFNVNSGAELNLYATTMNLGPDAVLNNNGGKIFVVPGEIFVDDTATINGKITYETDGYDVPVATTMEELKALNADPNVYGIDIISYLVIDEDITITKDVNVYYGGKLVIPDDVTVRTEARLGIHGDYLGDRGGEVLIRNGGRLETDDYTDMGGILTIDKGGYLDNTGIFSIYGTVTNNGTFKSDRDLMWSYWEDQPNWLWIGNDPIIPVDDTMTQDEFEAYLAEGNDILYKTVVVEDHLVLNEYLCLEYPGRIIVPEGATLEVNFCVDFLDGWIEVMEGGTLINNGAMNIYTGALVIRDGATLITHELNTDTEAGQHIEVHAGWLTIETDDIQVNHNETEWPSDRFISYWPQGHYEYNLNLHATDYEVNHDQDNFLDENMRKYVTVNMSVNSQEDLEALSWYANKAEEVTGHIWSPIYVDQDFTTAWNMVLNFNELWDDIPALTIGNNATLTNHGAFFVHEFAKILIEKGATLDNSEGDIWVFGGDIIALDEEGFIAGDRFYREAANGDPVYSEEQLRTWLENNNEGNIELMGDITLTGDMTFEGVNLHIRNGATLTVPENMQMSFQSGNLYIRGGNLVVEGILYSDSYISVERNGVLNLTDGTFEGWNNIFVSDNGQVLGMNQMEISKNHFVSTEEELFNAVYDSAYKTIEIYVEGDITLHSDLIIPSNMWLNITPFGSLTVADGTTLLVFGYLNVYGELMVQKGAALRIEEGGRFYTEGFNYHNEGTEYFDSEAELQRNHGVDNAEDLLYALKNGSKLDNLYIGGEITLPENTVNLVIPANLTVTVEGELTIPEAVELTVNGKLLLDGGTVNMNAKKLVNNGRISAYFGGTMNVGDSTVVSGNGMWTMEEAGNINSTDNRLDNLIDFMCGAADVEELKEKLAIAAERTFKSENIYLNDTNVDLKQDLTIPEGTNLVLEWNVIFTVKSGSRLTNDGIIKLRGLSELIVEEGAEYINHCAEGKDPAFNGAIHVMNGEGRVFLFNGDKIYSLVDGEKIARIYEVEADYDEI